MERIKKIWRIFFNILILLLIGDLILTHTKDNYTFTYIKEEKTELCYSIIKLAFYRVGITCIPCDSIPDNLLEKE